MIILRYSRPAGLVYSAFAARIRQFHSTEILLKKVAQEIKFPYLKDKSPIIKAFHKNEDLPFNILRDILKFPVMSPESLDEVSFAWMDYFTMGDEGTLFKQMEIEKPEIFWMKTIRVAISDEGLLRKIIGLLSQRSTENSMKFDGPISETLMASLLYVGKYEQAFHVYTNILTYSNNIQWDIILNVALALETDGPLRVLEAIHKEQGRNLYSLIIPNLKSLDLKENYIHSWNNKLIRLGDFPKSSSAPMNVIFQGMIETSNLQSFGNCLKNIAKHLEAPAEWLDAETSRLITNYIILSKDQESTFKTIMGLFGATAFQKQFYITLLHQSKIPTKTLTTFSGKAGIPQDDIRFREAKCKRLLDENPEEFWRYTSELIEKVPPLRISLHILSLYLRDFNNLPKAFDFAVHLLTKYPFYQNLIAKTFIIESTSKLEAAGMSNDLILEFEKALKNEDAIDDKIQNYLIFSSLKLSYFRCAIERIELLLSNPVSVFETSTIENASRMLSRCSVRIPMDFAEAGESPNHYIMRLILRMHQHSESISEVTLNRILRRIVMNLEHEESEKFCLEVAEYVKSETRLNFDSSNARHPLRLVFDDNLITQILIRGFKNSDAPWSGLETLSKLQYEGVYIPKNLLKKHVIRTFRAHGLPNSERTKIDPRKQMSTNLSIGVIVSKINEIEQRM